MKIYLTTGVGYGKTPLSAFDGALADAGVMNFNLIVLSSVIPPATEVVHEKMPVNESEWGNKLYCVKAEMRSRQSGRFIGAALGWYQLEDGRGVFVEHEETGEIESSVEADLKEEVKRSIMDLCKNRNIDFQEEKMGIKIRTTQVKDLPASVIVVAAYKSEDWS
jgi:arginine decarboxylase